MDRAVLATANELFNARQYSGVVAMVGDALETDPDCVPLLLLRARARIGLRRDLEAQADLRDIIRLAPQCGLAYQLLGVLAARRDENESAAIFFREALRLDPDDACAGDWLAIVEATARPAAVANKLPAPATAAGRFPSTPGPLQRARTANDGQPRSLAAPFRRERPGSQPRFAKGTYSPQDDRPTQRFSGERDPTLVPARGTLGPGSGASALRADTPSIDQPRVPQPPRMPSGSSPTLDAYSMTMLDPYSTTKAGAQPVRRPFSQPQTRSSVPEMPGFGDYLVSTGILTRERLRAAQAYQRSMKVQLSTAIVTLGLATPQRIEWAAVAHHSHVGRER